VTVWGMLMDAMQRVADRDHRARCKHVRQEAAKLPASSELRVSSLYVGWQEARTHTQLLGWSELLVGLRTSRLLLVLMRAAVHKFLRYSELFFHSCVSSRRQAARRGPLVSLSLPWPSS
jgi:hypothetical protein